MVTTVRHRLKLQRLRKALERTAFASLMADICISALTLLSLWLGESYTIGFLFIINYLLTAIVALSLILMAWILALQHGHRFSKIMRLFRFR